MNHSFLVHEAEDAVGVAVRDIDAGAHVEGRVQTGGSPITVAATQAVPLGHKIALRPIAAGEPVTKYGVAIGRATVDIAVGDHVHTHNLKGERWA